MTWVEIGLLALALSADAFAVGAGLGLVHADQRERLRVSFHFGLFQALMPLLSGMAGSSLRRVTGPWLNWVGGGLLLFLGLRMLFASRTSLFGKGAQAERTSKGGKETNATRGWTLVGLSLSVSIDALGAGFVLGVRKAPLLGAAMMIGCTTMVVTFVGMLAGTLVGRKIGPIAAGSGGLILVFLGLAALFY